MEVTPNLPQGACDDVRNRMSTFPSVSSHFIPFVPPQVPPPAPSAVEPSSQYIAAREHVLNTIITAQPSDASTPPQPEKRKRGRPKGSRTKRKLEIDDDSSVRRKRRARGGDGDDSDTSVEVTLTQTITKSGRSVTKPAQYVPPVPSPASAGKRRGPTGGGRRVIEVVVCRLCRRANSPHENPIVYCSSDGCGATYHQYCHRPPVPRASIDDEKADWFCARCTQPAGGSGQKRRRVKPVTISGGNGGLVAAAELSRVEKQEYFTTLSPSALVDLLVDLATAHPALPLFHPDYASVIVPPQPLEPDDPGYDTDPPAHYPTPGFGLARNLPPEELDAAWLVDDNLLGVYSHTVVEMSGKLLG